MTDEPAPKGFRRVPKIPEKYRKAPRCTICRDMIRLPIVDAYLAKGMSGQFIADTLTETMNLPTTVAIVLSHRKHYTAPIPKQAEKPADLAILVRDRVRDAVIDGTLEPTVAHGLTAQAILDKRAQSARDEELRIKLAKLLTGGEASAVAGFLAPPPDLDPNVIEGEAVEVP